MSENKLTRRDFLNLTTTLIYILGTRTYLNQLWRLAFENMEKTRPIKLGTTFSEVQCRYLGLDYKETFKEISSLGLDYIRLCSYWNEIEPQEGQYDFTSLDWLIMECQRQSIEIVLAVGMKAPRWPEFHFPQWIEETYVTSKTDNPLDIDPGLTEYAITFVEKVISHTQDIHISYWQVENEALSKLGVAGKRYLSYEFLKREIDLVRKARPGQKILLTNSINLMPLANSDLRAFKMSLPLADAIGINVYTKVPISPSDYLEVPLNFWKKLVRWHEKIIESNKEPWIAEAQAEPWEWNQLVATAQYNNPSSSPEKATNLAISLGQMGYETVLLWGCEYWVWQRNQGNPKWLNSISKLIDLEHASATIF